MPRGAEPSPLQAWGCTRPSADGLQQIPLVPSCPAPWRSDIQGSVAAHGDNCTGATGIPLGPPQLAISSCRMLHSSSRTKPSQSHDQWDGCGLNNKLRESVSSPQELFLEKMAATTQGTTSLSHPGSKRCHRWFFISPENCTTGSQRSCGGLMHWGFRNMYPSFRLFSFLRSCGYRCHKCPCPWQNKMLGPVAGQCGPASDEPY